MSRVTVSDVAAAAGVSVATVDRVLNGRPGVRTQTIDKVQEAISALHYWPDRLATRLARGREYRFCAVLPDGSNSFMRALAEEARSVGARMASERVVLDLKHTDVFDGAILAATLETLGGYDGVAVVALDHPQVREAINALVRSGTHVVTLVSDVPDSRRDHYVGVTNTAAGRTAATLMGRFAAGQTGKIGLIAGSVALRDHVERQFGFEQVIAAEYPALGVLPVREGRDQWERVRDVTQALLEDTPDLVGIYNVGAGNRGIVEALEAAGRADSIVFIAHELTAYSRRALVRGTIDAVLNQDPGHEMRSAVRVLMALADKEPIVEGQERIRIDIFLRDNLP